MPWDISSVDKHKKGLTPIQKKKWVTIANKVYKGCMKDVGNDKKCSPMAIKIANEKCMESKRIMK